MDSFRAAHNERDDNERMAASREGWGCVLGVLGRFCSVGSWDVPREEKSLKGRVLFCAGSCRSERRAKQPGGTASTAAPALPGALHTHRIQELPKKCFSH